MNRWNESSKSFLSSRKLRSLLCIDTPKVWKVMLRKILRRKALTTMNTSWLQFAQCYKSTAGDRKLIHFTHLELITDSIIVSCSFRWRTTRPGDILDRRMRAALRAHGPKLEGVLFVAPFTYCIQQAWLQVCLCAIGIYNLYLACWYIERLKNFGLFVYQYFQLQLHDQVSAVGLSNAQ